ncbi:hypothetical protein GCM10009634_61930 [Saccharothrix xinjiangensis]
MSCAPGTSPGGFPGLDRRAAGPAADRGDGRAHRGGQRRAGAHRGRALVRRRHRDDVHGGHHHRRGVGTGLVVDGKLVEGSHGLPPRLSHILVDPTGPHCGYGHRGCASSFLMTHVILRQLDGSPTYDEAAALAIRKTITGAV